jgi:anti-sigma regulatory factor (Ser/Thr protein kinase)
MVTMQMNLAIEEAVVNVMDYAYPEGVKGYVDIEVWADEQWLTFVITDSGKPFDPTTKGEVDITLSAEERDIGGLGIYLVRQIMDSIGYEYKDGHNVLTLKKKVKG